MVESFSLEKTSKIPKLNLSPSLPLNHVHQCHISMIHSPSVPHLRGPQSLSATSPGKTAPPPPGRSVPMSDSSFGEEFQLAQISHCWKSVSEHPCPHAPCSRRHGLVFVLLQFSGQDAVQNVMTLAHMIGHSLGFNHDDRKQFQHKPCDCNCTQRGCIMGSSPG